MSRPKTNEEIAAEIQKGINVKENMECLYKQNTGLIFRYAKKYIKDNEDIEDWLSEGYFAVYMAAMNFDYEKGSFNTCLGYYLLKAFTEYRQKTHPGAVPAYVFEDIIKYGRAKGKVESEMGENAAPEKIAERAGLSAARMERIRDALVFDSPVSLHMNVSEDENEESELLNFLPDSYDMEGDYIGRIRREEARAELWELLQDELSQRQLEVIRFRYWENYTFIEIGKMWGVSSVMAGLVHQQAIKKLRKKYNYDLLKTIAEDL